MHSHIAWFVVILLCTSALSLSPQAIHELYRGEQDLIEDLQLARKVSRPEDLEFGSARN